MKRMLDSIASCDFDTVHKSEVELVLADNNDGNVEKDMFLEFCSENEFNSTYEHVSPPNISLARNSCVRRAQGRWIVFVDDDQSVRSDFFTKLHDAWMMKVENDDSYCGAIFSVDVDYFCSDSDDEEIKKIHESNFKGYVYGVDIPRGHGRTSGIIFSRAALKGIEGPFNEEYGRTGGEDCDLLTRMHDRGLKLTGLPMIRVTEHFVPGKTDRANVLLISYRMGKIYATMIYDNEGAVLWRILHGLKNIATLFLSVVKYYLAAMQNRKDSRLTEECLMMRQLGKVSAVVKNRYKPYGN